MQPAFEYGTEVRLTRNVRNDGTYPGTAVGELLIKRGAVGCIYDVGSYLQDQIIYRVHFLDEAKTVGCREEELILASDPWVPNKYDFNQKVVTLVPIVIDGETVVEENRQGLVMKVLRDCEKGIVNYHVHFANRMFQMPEAALEAAE
ncbi:nitrogen fixation protein NifZ [Teredinibacter turnerae]|uniref:Nitrogen fixation protein NifZ n=1 Tax=Teredinibacter turnerae (strain ATCC 39867 / T7901) TaxID=377629 RepID=C5BTG4_TERTT|nr:nitrogen fixation protein NifZ [Teredinibacter turnerae]ACR12927.1 nitrogen fixation protein NifZ [Teredinibacter turnerae T7901]